MASILSTPTNNSSIRDFLSAGMSVTSFDIETTGVVGQDFRITQMGFTTDVLRDVDTIENVTSIERAIQGSWRERTSVSELLQEELDWMDSYNKNLPPGSYPLQSAHLLKMPNEQVLFEAHKVAGAADFGKQQLDTGALKTIVQAFRDNVEVNSKGELVFKEGVSTVKATVEQLRGVLEDNNGILLIQNANFEDKVHQDLIKFRRGIQHIEPKFAAKFNDVIYGTVSSNTLFSIPKDVRRGRDRIRNAVTSLKDKYRLNQEVTKEVEDVMKARAEMQRTILNRIESARAAGKSVVLDLMDFTDIYQMTLLDKGVESAVSKVIPGFKMNPLLIQRGRSVELLARVLLSEKETHTALSDARQQTAIFNKMIRMTDELERGIISEDSINYIKALNDPATGELDFVKTIHSRLTDIQIGAAKIKDFNEREAYVQDSIRKLVDRVNKTYSGMEEGKNFKRKEVLSILENHFAEDNKIKDPFSHLAPLKKDPTPVSTNSGNSGSIKETGETKTRVDAPPTNNESLPNANSKSITLTRHEKLQDTIGSIKALQERISRPELLNNMKPPAQVASEAITTVSTGMFDTGIPKVAKYGLMGLGAAAMVNWILADGRDRSRESDKNIRNDTYDALYENLYVGQAYADWRERNNAHRMLY